MTLPEELTYETLRRMTPAERALAEEIVARRPVWSPLPGPQANAYHSDADIIGYGGCVSGDTEFLTPSGWKRIDEFDPVDLVAQWSPDGTYRFASPKRYIDTPVVGGTLIRFQTKRLSMVLSEDHRVPFLDYKGAFTVRLARYLEHRPSRRMIPVQCTPAEAPGLPYSDDELRLGVAIHADGNFDPRARATYCRISLRKPRKKERLESLLTRLGISWTLHGNAGRPTEDRYAFDSPFTTKNFSGWWGATPAQMEVIFDEIHHWDGAVSGAQGGDICYNTAIKGDAEFVQYIAHALGRCATISVVPPRSEKHSTLYRVHVTRAEHTHVAMRSVERSASGGVKGTRVDRVRAERMYCFETDTGYWVARHNGLIFCTGNSAGGGKTDLAAGMALTKHHRTLIMRRNGTELKGIHDRLLTLLGGRDGYNGQDSAWNLTVGGKPRMIEYGATPNAGDETKYQGRPHDLLVFDESVQFPRQVPMFLRTWLRHEDPSQHCQMLFTFNPPTSAEGQWVVDFFGPWLDPHHPRPAKPGELRWYLMLAGGKEQEVEGPTTVEQDGVVVRAMSRTFFPARVTDNPYYMASGYASMLNSLEEPFRSMMLKGDFGIGREDDPFAVFPSQWVEEAMDRWKKPDRLAPMDSVGVDVARGGRDSTVIVCRHGQWYGDPTEIPGKSTPDGATTGAMAMAAARDRARIHVDVIGVGASPVDWLREKRQPVIGVNVSTGATAMSRGGGFGFLNLRAQLFWQLREALDPQYNTGIALPKSRKLRAEMAAAKWELKGKVLQVMSREDFVKVLGRSPDVLSAVLLASMDSADSEAMAEAMTGPAQRREYDPLATLAPTSGATPSRDYDPYRKI